MVILAGHITVEPQQCESYLADCVSIVERTRGVAGCLDVAISADLIDPVRINIFEQWESRAALEDYRGGPSDEQGSAMLSASVADYDIAEVGPFFEEGTS